MIILMADLHGAVEPARAILDKVRAEYSDLSLVVLGDIVDCRVEEGFQQGDTEEWSHAAYQEPGLLELLAGAEFVVGNQEERLTKALGLPDSGHPLEKVLSAPVGFRIGEAMMTHGHRFPWQDAGSRKLFPVPDFTDYRLVFHGHHHHQRLAKFSREHSSPELIAWVPGEWIGLGGSARWAINVGPVFERSGWVEYDQEGGSVRFRQL